MQGQVIYAKEKYGTSDKTYHELCMVSESLPHTCKIKQKRSEMNKNWDTIGGQQSIKIRLTDRIKNLEQTALPDASFPLTSTIRVKLTGDSTYIGTRQHIVTFGFTILDC